MLRSMLLAGSAALYVLGASLFLQVDAAPVSSDDAQSLRGGTCYIFAICAKGTDCEKRCSGGSCTKDGYRKPLQTADDGSKLSSHICTDEEGCNWQQPGDTKCSS